MSSAPSAASQDPFQDLRTALRQFAAERDWDQFHSPKNLAIALSVKAAELLEHFQWTSDADSTVLPPDKRLKLQDRNCACRWFNSTLGHTRWIALCFSRAR
jgi:NTP pyrophosphatase (non-canonical NTP hydrolase)